MTNFTKLFAVLSAVWLFASIQIGSVYSADPELVGILADAVEPQTAKALELTDEQLEKLNELIAQQESRALDLSDRMRELPPADRQELMNSAIRELEAKAYQLLSVNQRAKLEQVRLNRIGLRALSDPAIAETLSLSEGQSEQVAAILSNRVQLMREVGADRVDAEMQNRLRKVLTNAQFATWQTLAGGGAPAPVAVETQVASSASPSVESRPTTASPSDSSVAIAQPDPNSAPMNESSTGTDSQAVRPMTEEDNAKLVINFPNGAEWQTVLKWIAGEADLSLQLDTIPTGTFTYRDTRKYTVAQAIDIMNGVLLGKGYTLVRRQRTLLVIDLGSGESAEVTRGLIRELAQLVTPDQLDDRGEFELLKCLFVLSRMTPSEAEEQVKNLIGPQGSVVPLNSSGQLLVVETGGKLRLIREMIERVENPNPMSSTKVVSIPLQFVTADEVLSIARGHLGIEDDASKADGIMISTDAFGSTIYASGTASKIQILNEIVMKVDTKPSDDGATSVQVQQPFVRTHPIANCNPDTAMNVLQTLLAGIPNVRLGLDADSKSIIASAPQAEHDLIDKTLNELSGNGSVFEIIPLTRLDPKTAITTIEKLLGKSTSTTSSSTSSASSADGPILYGDSYARTLMVKGTKQQIELVKGMIQQIEQNGPNMSMLGDKVKFYPSSGKSADRMIEQMQLLFEAQNKNAKIRIRKPTEPTEETTSANTRRTTLGGAPLPKETRKPADSTESPADDAKEAAKEVQIDAPKPNDKAQPSASMIHSNESSSEIATLSIDQVRSGRLVQINSESEIAAGDNTSKAEETDDTKDNDAPAIDIIQTPNGMIVTSNDPELLAEFEQMAMLLNEQMANGPVEPTIFYLKYVPAASAAELLKQAMTGQVATSSGGGGLLGDVASNVLGGVGGGLLGGLLGGGGGGTSTTTSGPPLASGEVSIVPDSRLNYLLVYANPTDLELIDQLLKVIDQEDSPLMIETNGRPQIIPVVYADATEIAAIVKEAFASRIAQSQATGAGGANRQPSPQEFVEMLRGGNGRGGRAGGGGNQAAQMPEQKMTISVDSRNNAIVVTGPTSLYKEVKEFVETIDQGSIDTQEDVQVVRLGGNMNATVMQSALQAVLGQQARTNIAGQTQPGNNAVPGQQSLSPQNLQQRADFFRQFQGGNQPGNFGGRNTGGQFGGQNFGGQNFGGRNTGNATRGGQTGRGTTGGNRNTGGGGRTGR